jgi:hypothetical protein
MSENHARSLAGITDVAGSENLSLFSGWKRKAMDTWISPIPVFRLQIGHPGSPHWHPAIHGLRISQNVAGLWLKYGAWPHHRCFLATQDFS